MSELAEKILGEPEAEIDEYETFADELLKGIETKDKKLTKNALRAFILKQSLEPDEE